MMWIIHHVIIITLCTSIFNVLADKTKGDRTSKFCDVLHPLLYGIICFLIFLVVILLILFFKMFISMQNGLIRDTIHIVSDTGESADSRQNNVLSVSSPLSNGGDDSSSTSSGTPEASLVDLSSSSQRYASLHGRSKSSDYINVSESALHGQVDFHDKKIDYVNVKGSQRKKINRKGQASCDGTTSVSSDESVNYSKIVFTNK